MANGFEQRRVPSTPVVIRPGAVGKRVSEPGERSESEADRLAETALAKDPSKPAVGAGRAQRTGRLDPTLRDYFEPRFGHSFADVEVHADRGSAAVAGQIGAEAFTVGNHIAFGANRYSPAEPRGLRLLAHELGHVVQQRTAGPQLQRKFVATGRTADFANAVNGILGVQYEIRVAADGTVSVGPSGVSGPPTQEAYELLSTIRTVIADGRTTTMEFIHGTTSARASDRNVIVGYYQLSRVDLDDVAAFDPNAAGVTTRRRSSSTRSPSSTVNRPTVKRSGRHTRPDMPRRKG